MFIPFLESLRTESNKNTIDKVLFTYLESIQPWGMDSVSDSYILDEIYDRASAYAHEAHPELEYFLNSVCPDTCLVLLDIKSKESFKNKVLRGKHPFKIHDVLRSTVLAPTSIIADEIANRINDSIDLHEFELKDKLSTTPGVWHLKAPLSNGLIAEIQIMPHHMWNYAQLQHRAIYEKYRDLPDSTNKKYKEKIARMLMTLGGSDFTKKY